MCLWPQVTLKQPVTVGMSLPVVQQYLQTGRRIAQGAGHYNVVAHLSARAQTGFSFGNGSDNADVEYELLGRTGGVATHKGKLMLRTQLVVTFHQLVEVLYGNVGRYGDGQKGAGGTGAHGGNIAEIDGQGLMAQVAGTHFVTYKMNVLHQHVGGVHE